MNIKRWLLSLVAAFILAGLGGASAPAGEKTETVKGYVVDSACVFLRGVTKPLKGGQCALECARAGSPLVILSEEGAIYWPISDAMPAQGQNPRLIPHAGKLVRATGKVHERSGSRAIVIEKIEAAPSAGSAGG